MIFKMLVFLLLIFIVTDLNFIKAESYDSSEAKYIDELPEKEKKEFIAKIARRIIEDVNSKEINDGVASGDVISDERLNVHSAYVSKLLKDEAENIKKSKLQNEQTTGRTVENIVARENTDINETTLKIPSVETTEKREDNKEDQLKVKSDDVLISTNVENRENTKQIQVGDDEKKDKNNEKSEINGENIQLGSLHNNSEKTVSQNDTKLESLVVRSEINPYHEADKSLKTGTDKSEENNNEKDLSSRDDTIAASKLAQESENQAIIDLTLRKSNDKIMVSENDTKLLQKKDDQRSDVKLDNDKGLITKEENKGFEESSVTKIKKNEPVSIEITISNATDYKDSSNENEHTKKDEIPVKVVYDDKKNDDNVHPKSKTTDSTVIKRRDDADESVLKNPDTDQEKFESKENPETLSVAPNIEKPKRIFRKSLMNDEFDEKENSQDVQSKNDINVKVNKSVNLVSRNNEKGEESLMERLTPESNDTFASKDSIPTSQFSITNDGMTTIKTYEVAIETENSTSKLGLRHTVIDNFEPNVNETFTYTTPNQFINTTEEIVKMRTQFVTGWPPDSDNENISAENVHQTTVAPLNQAISNLTNLEQSKSNIVNPSVAQSQQENLNLGDLNLAQTSQPNLGQTNQVELDLAKLNKETDATQVSQDKVNTANTNQYQLVKENLNVVHSNVSQSNQPQPYEELANNLFQSSAVQKTEPRTNLAQANVSDKYQPVSNEGQPNIAQENAAQIDIISSDAVQPDVVRSDATKTEVTQSADIIKDKNAYFNTSFYADKISNISQSDVARSDTTSDNPPYLVLTASDASQPELMKPGSFVDKSAQNDPLLPFQRSQVPKTETEKPDIIENEQAHFNSSFYKNKLSSLSQIDVEKSEVSSHIPQPKSKQLDLIDDINVQHNLPRSDDVFQEKTEKSDEVEDKNTNLNTSFYEHRLSTNTTEVIDTNFTKPVIPDLVPQQSDIFVEKNIYVNASFYKEKLSNSTNVAQSNITESESNDPKSEIADIREDKNTHFNTSFYENKLSNVNLSVNLEKNTGVTKNSTPESSVSDEYRPHYSKYVSSVRSVTDSAKNFAEEMTEVKKENQKDLSEQAAEDSHVKLFSGIYKTAKNSKEDLKNEQPQKTVERQKELNQGDYSIKEINVAINIKVDKNQTTSDLILPLTTTEAGIIKKEIYYPIETPVVIVNDSAIALKNYSDFKELPKQNRIIYGMKDVPAKMLRQGLQPDFETEKRPDNIKETIKKSQLTQIIDNVQDILKNVNDKMRSGAITFLEKPKTKPKYQLNPLKHFPKQPFIVNEVLPGQKLFEKFKPKKASSKVSAKLSKPKSAEKYSDEAYQDKPQDEQPRYAPVHDYSPKNAYYNPNNVYLPNDGDEDVKLVDERSKEEKRKEGELEKAFDYEIDKDEKNYTDQTSNLNIEPPRYAPVHNYDLKNAYYNPNNIYALNDEEENKKIVDERSKEIDSKELEKTFDYEIQKTREPTEISQNQQHKSNRAEKLMKNYGKKQDELNKTFDYEIQWEQKPKKIYKKQSQDSIFSENLLKYIKNRLIPVLVSKYTENKNLNGKNGKSRYSFLDNFASKKGFFNNKKNVFEDDSNESKKTFDYEIQRAQKPLKLSNKLGLLLNSKETLQKSIPEWIDYDYYFGSYNRNRNNKEGTLRSKSKKKQRANDCGDDDEGENCRMVCGDVCGEESIEQKPKLPPNSASDEHPHNALLNKNPPISHIQQVGVILSQLGYNSYVASRDIRSKTSTTTEPSSGVNENWVGPDLDLLYNKKYDGGSNKGEKETIEKPKIKKDKGHEGKVGDKKSPPQEQKPKPEGEQKPKPEEEQKPKPEGEKKAVLRVTDDNSDEIKLLYVDTDLNPKVYSYLKDKIHLVSSSRYKSKTKDELSNRPIIILTERFKKPKKIKFKQSLLKSKPTDAIPLKSEEKRKPDTDLSTEKIIPKKYLRDGPDDEIILSDSSDTSESKESGEDAFHQNLDDVSSGESSELLKLNPDIVNLIIKKADKGTLERQRKLVEAFRDLGMLYFPNENATEFYEILKQLKKRKQDKKQEKKELNKLGHKKVSKKDLLRSGGGEDSPDAYVEVLTDMIINDDEALKKYDWLGTTVDIRSALKKINQMVDLVRQEDKEIHPKDLQILKYILYLHSIVDKPEEEVEDNSPPSNLRFSYTEKDSEELPRNLRFPVQHQKPNGAKKPKPSRRQERPWLATKGLKERAEDLSKLVDDLEESLDELHDAVKHISLITKYRNQKWFQNLKDLYLMPTTPKHALELMLHLQATRLFSLIEDSSKDGLEDNYVKYALSHTDQIEKTKKEFVFLVELLTELKKLK